MQRLSSFCTRYIVPLPIHLVLPRMASAAPIIAAAQPTLIIPPNHLKIWRSVRRFKGRRLKGRGLTYLTYKLICRLANIF